jgi:rod shape-determining protein MreB
MSKKDDVLYVGIDLGTSQSSITASNGQRHVVKSLVGWPLDMVSRKILKRDVLIGQEALDNRPMLDLHRPLERGLIKEGSEKDLAAVRELLGNLLSLVGVNGKRDNGQRVRAVVGVPAEAMRINKQQLRNTLTGMVDGLMVVSEPFAVAYGKDALLHTLIVDMGAGTTDFCVMMGRYPTDEDQRTLPNAGDAVDEQLSKLVRERYPDAQISMHMVREWKEGNSFVGRPKAKVTVEAPV